MKEVDVPSSLTPPPASDKTMYTNSVFGMNGMNEISRQHLIAHQHLIGGNEMEMPFNINMSAEEMSASPSCLLDDDALMQLLPNDPLVPKDRVGTFPDDDHKVSMPDTMHHSALRDLQLSASPHSVARTEHSNTVKSHSKGHSHSNSKHDDDCKEDMEPLTMKSMGIAPPCPPALQLQTSVDSCNPVIMGAVQAGVFGGNGVNASPTAIHLNGMGAIQAQQLMVEQHAHQYAQTAAAAAAVGGIVGGVTPFVNPYAVPTAMNPAMNATMNPYSVTPDIAMTAGAASPFVYNMQPLMTQGLRVQPPQTMMATTAPIAGDQTASRNGGSAARGNGSAF